MLQCKSSKNATSANSSTETQVSYEADILPLMQRSCTPCHFPENGKKIMLNTLQTTRVNIDDIMARIQLPSDNDKFMPFKSKKPALTQEEIAIFKKWIDQRMPK